MTVARTSYDTDALLGVYRELEPISEFWLQFFPGAYNSLVERIEWNKITNYRHLAPMVVPTAQGRPTWKAEEDIYAVQPGYLKPKDAVTAANMLRRRAGLGELGGASALSPQERFDASVAGIIQKHRSDIERRWEWMAAEAVLNGKITLEDDGYPRAEVDFGRASNHTVTLAGNSRWSVANVDIPGVVNGWVNRMASATFGGAPNVMIVGTEAWDAMSTNSLVERLLDRDIKNTSTTEFDLGVGNGEKVQLKGYLSRNLPVWVYSDYYQLADGTNTVYMDSRDVVLVGPNLQGVKAFGAILDKEAEFRAEPVFVKMWDDNDPSATIVMSQSAPLMVPVNPNASFRARVVS